VADVKAILAKAKAELAEGKLDTARNTLLMGGYVATLEPAIQKAFTDIIPEPKGLKEHADLLKGIKSKDAAARLKSAKELNKWMRKSSSLFIKEWAADPRFSEQLFSALDSETEAKPREELALAVEALLGRYFPDQRAFPVLAKLVGDKSKTVRRAAASGIPKLRHPDRYAVLAPLFKDKAAEVRFAWLVTIGPNKAAGLLTEAEAAQVFAPACECLGFDDRDVKKAAAAALQSLGDKRALPALEAALKAEDADSVKEYLANAIKALKAAK
jgi:HEAT repeat protein